MASQLDGEGENDEISEAFVECCTDDISAIVRTLPFLNMSKDQTIWVTADKERLTFTATSAVKDVRVNVWINKSVFHTYDCFNFDENDEANDGDNGTGGTSNKPGADIDDDFEKAADGASASKHSEKQERHQQVRIRIQLNQFQQLIQIFGIDSTMTLHVSEEKMLMELLTEEENAACTVTIPRVEAENSGLDEMNDFEAFDTMITGG